MQSKLWLLAVVGSLNAVIAAYYYLSVIMTMWFKDPEEATESPEPLTPSLAAALAVAVVAVFWLGMAPSRLLEAATGLAATLI